MRQVEQCLLRLFSGGGFVVSKPPTSTSITSPPPVVCAATAYAAKAVSTAAQKLVRKISPVCAGETVPVDTSRQQGGH